MANYRLISLALTIVAAVSARFFCAYCFRVSTEVTESSNQISIIVINMLVILR